MRLCFTGPKNQHTERWVTYFANRGHEVHLIIDEPVCYERVIVHCLHLELKKNASYFIKKFYHLRRLIRFIQPDLLHTHYITGEAYVSSLLGFHPYVVSIWGNDILLRPHRSLDEKLFTKYVLHRADLITADSQAQIDAAVALGAASGKCDLVQWGVDTDLFYPGVESDIRTELGIGNAPLVISQRQFLPLYNIDIIVKAFARAVRSVPDAHMIMTGSGGDEGEIRTMVSRLGMENRVHFSGYLPYHRLPAYLAAADLAVSVPSSDGTAMSVLESMACGVPLIVSDLPSNREWITDGENGFIVPIRDVEALAERMIHTLQNPQTRSALTEQNVVLIRNRADRKRNMASMEKNYIRLIDRERS